MAIVTVFVVLLGGLVVLALLASSRPVDRVLTRVIRRVLTRFTDLEVRDFEAVLEDEQERVEAREDAAAG
jgi:hypothetical protein